MDNKQTNLGNREKGLLSCIVLTYKQKSYLIDAIQSVLEQDYPFIELIVTDDGSPQFDAASISAYIEKHKQDNVKSYRVYHHKTNVGTVKNINDAIKMSHGEYIKMLGGDDSYPTVGTFNAQVCLLQTNSEKLLCMGYTVQCDCNLTPIHDERVEKGNNSLKDIFEMEYLQARRYIQQQNIFPVVTQSICFRHLFFEKHGLYDESYFLLEDVPETLVILKSADEVCVYHAPTVLHRSNVGISSSHEFFSARRVRYYQDQALFARREIAPCKQVYCWLDRLEIPRVFQFQYQMAMSKSDARPLNDRILIVLSYIDTVLYYALFHAGRLSQRLRDRLVTKREV